MVAASEMEIHWRKHMTTETIQQNVKRGGGEGGKTDSVSSRISIIFYIFNVSNLFLIN